MDLGFEESRLKKIKMPLIFSLIALALSFLIGLVNGVNFWSIVMRSVILGLITGAFVLGATMLLEHFVPELFVQSDSKDDDFDEDVAQAGKNLNISIDEPIDLEDTVSVDASKSSASVGTANNTGSMSGGSETLKADASDLAKENSKGDEFDDDIEELEELEDEGGEEDNAVSANEASENIKTNTEGTDGLGDNAEKVETLSELPDLQEFVPLENATDMNSEESDFTQVGTGKFDVSADLNSADVDTNLMAEAIKTVLRRDS